MTVHEVILPVADQLFDRAEIGKEVPAEYDRRNTERGRTVGKITAAKAHELHVDDLIQIFQQRVDVRLGAAGITAADEVDYFHFALQSTCAHRKNTV